MKLTRSIITIVQGDSMVLIVAFARIGRDKFGAMEFGEPSHWSLSLIVWRSRRAGM